MESTVLVSVVLGLVSTLLALDSSACVVGVEVACVMSAPANMVTLILSSVTLVPVSACLITAWLDARDATSGEHQPLLRNNTTTAMANRPRRVITYLYAGHLLSAWGDRMWGFAVPILFMDIFVDTLLPSAAFSLAMYIVCIFMIPTVGHHLDRWNRWTAMKYAIILENLMIVLNSIILGLILLVTNADGVHKPEWTWPLVLMFLGTLVCGGVGQVLNDAQTLGIERDWVVVIAGPDNSTGLAKLNTTMRRIDLSCNILGPMAFGFIVDFAGGDATTRAMVGAAVVGLWNLISTPLEYCMTHDIYHLVPELAVRATVEEDNQVDTKGEMEKSPTSSAELGTITRYAKMWSNYVKHPVFLVSFSFCALYMTILSGGALNTAYLKWRGIPNSLLGASRGAGAVVGLVGTLIFPCLRTNMKRVERVAVLSVWIFWLCLVPVLVAFLVTGESIVSDYVMLVCVVISRAWLWSTDLAETQIMQEWIAPNQRGAINSMQTATYQFFFILILLSGVIFHDPRQFEALVFFSLAAVLASALGFTYWGVKYGRHRDLYVSTTTTSSTKA
ncbi:Ferroportin1 (FPN1) [Phytophthora infestans]|uniref:Solute carrier family 40 member n=1 Tax=Phytophthora infestans TaxID=4787 RepID=A0A833SK39_PHYIN|nr:Ferroportin1 (FPN1) [Phytophthora infestans]